MICAVYRNKVGFFASYFMSVSNSIRERILLLKIKHGDAGAYAELYDFYVEPIYRYVLFRVPAKELAEDVTSEVFLKVWERLSGGSEVQNLRAYLYQVARNQIADYFRKDHQATLPVEMVDEKQTMAESVELERYRNFAAATAAALARNNCVGSCGRFETKRSGSHYWPQPRRHSRAIA